MQSYTIAIADLHVRATLPSLDKPHLYVGVELEGSVSEGLRLEMEFSDMNGFRSIWLRHPIPGALRKVIEFFNEAVHEIELWWPVGYGKQALYNVRMNVLDKVP